MRKTVVAVVLAAVIIAAAYYLGARLGRGSNVVGGVGPKGPDDEPIIIAADSAIILDSAKTAAKAGFGGYIHSEHKSHNHNYLPVQGDNTGPFVYSKGYVPTCIRDSKNNPYTLGKLWTITVTLMDGRQVTISSSGSSIDGYSVDVMGDPSAFDVNQDRIQFASPPQSVSFPTPQGGTTLMEPIHLHYANTDGYCPDNP